MAGDGLPLLLHLYLPLARADILRCVCAATPRAAIRCKEEGLPSNVRETGKSSATVLSILWGVFSAASAATFSTPWGVYSVASTTLSTLRAACSTELADARRLPRYECVRRQRMLSRRQFVHAVPRVVTSQRTFRLRQEVQATAARRFTGPSAWAGGCSSSARLLVAAVGCWGRGSRPGELIVGDGFWKGYARLRLTGVCSER